MHEPLKAVIIGAGIAGLASAIRLSVQGMDVSVFEKNDYPGGKIRGLEINGYHFDSGPSLFTEPENIEELFELAGEPIGEYFTYTKQDISGNYFYDDGTVINAYADLRLFAKELVDKAGEKESSLHSYLERSARMYQAIGKVFLDHSLHKTRSLFRPPVLRALAATRWSYLFRTMHSVNGTCFENPKTVQLFDRYATYNGSDPYRAPGMLNMIPHLEHNGGVYYPKGGMISIADALYKLAVKKGVVFHFNAPVQRIIRNERKAMGIVVNDANVHADIVVSNMDVYFTYHQLLREERKAKKLLKQERSSSALVFYWGMKQSFPQLGLHNIFFAADYEAEFDHLFRLKTGYGDPTVYINITAKCEPGKQAPAGKENWFVMVNVPADSGQDWGAYRDKYRSAVIKKLNRQLQSDIEPLIEAEAVMDPVAISSDTASYGGSLYGSSSNSRMAAFLRHPNFTTGIQGLYFVGGSVHPGGGIPLCLRSAKIMSGLVARDINRMTKHA